MNFLHTFHPQPILFEYGFIKIHWYGLLMVIAIFVGIFITVKLAKRYGFSKDHVYDLVFYLVIFSLLGARIYAVLLFPSYYSQYPLEIFQVWKGGLAIHGAIIGGIITLYYYAQRKKQSFWLWADILVVPLALGQAIGRWGNYFNQELFGKPTNLPWGIPIDTLSRGAFSKFEFFHPTFLYESILNFIVFIVLLTLHIHRIKKQETMNKHPLTPTLSHDGERESSAPSLIYKNERGRILEIRNWKLEISTITLLYLIFYSLIRIAMEQFRIDETPQFFGMRFPIIISGLIFIASIILYFYFLRKQKTREEQKSI